MNPEIIVVGAGPAGCAAAIELAQKGHRVLLMDKEEFPRNKVCGDAIAPMGLEILRALGLKEKLEKTDFYKIDGFRFTSLKGRVLNVGLQSKRLDLRTLVAPRLLLDAMLKEHAVACGAKFLKAKAIAPVQTCGRVAGVRAVVAGGKSVEFRSRILIGADGSNSIIARHLLGFRQNSDNQSIAIRGYIQNLELFHNKAEIALLPKIWPGYAWIFPTGNGRANIGLGVSVPHYRRMRISLKQAFWDFVRSPLMKSRSSRNAVQVSGVSAGILNGYSPKPMMRSFDGALLIGDAAALVNPLNGGGIINALVSGGIAADVAGGALVENDVSRNRLREYEFLLQRRIGKELMVMYCLKKLLYSTSVVEFLVKGCRSGHFISKTINQIYQDLRITIETGS